MRVTSAVVLLLWVAGGVVCGQTFPAAIATHTRVTRSTVRKAPESAHQLIKDVMYNEHQAWKKHSFWEYRSHLVTDSKNELREQIETPEGPVYRVLEKNGKPLAGAQAAAEKARLAGLLNNPAKLRKVEAKHEADEARLGHVMALVPKAYVFHYAGVMTGDRVVLDFAPNPKFEPSGYVDRIMSGLTGQIVVNQRLKRMISMKGRIAQKITFGYGILGYVDPGGTFRIHRTQVSPMYWKTDLVAVNVHGRVLLFSDVSKQEKETRWGFAPVSKNISLAEAGNDLKRAAMAFEASEQSTVNTEADAGTVVAGSVRQR